MVREMKYGEGCTLRLDLPPEVLLADCTRVRGQPLDDPAAAVAAALQNPLDFPPIAKATVPGDRIAIALDRGMPQAGSIVAGMVQALLRADAQASDITVVLPSGGESTAERRLTAHLAADVQEDVRTLTHDPRDAARLSYLAASRDGRPIYFNRVLCDADVVLPVCTARLEGSLGYAGVYSGLFPGFSNEETQLRLQPASSADWGARQRRCHEEADEAAWLLGVQFTVQVVPGPGESILSVLAGDAKSVAARAQELCESVWLYETPRPASLVVATIEGGQEQQTWENFARALFSASRVVSDEGAIVLCTDLRRAPGPALQRLAARPSGGDGCPDASHDRSADDLSAALLARALERTRVYLLSRLDGDVVEDLGLGYVAKAEEIDRLSRQHDSCILLANAQHACFGPARPVAADRAYYARGPSRFR